MSSKRLSKVNQLIKEEIGKLLQKEIGEEFGLITVQDVETTPDLRKALIWISIFDKDKYNQVLKKIDDITPGLQKILNRKLTMKYVPKITFKLDQSLDYADEINRLFKKIKEDSKEK